MDLLFSLAFWAIVIAIARPWKYISIRPLRPEEVLDDDYPPGCSMHGLRTNPSYNPRLGGNYTF